MCVCLNSALGVLTDIDEKVGLWWHRFQIPRMMARSDDRYLERLDCGSLNKPGSPTNAIVAITEQCNASGMFLLREFGIFADASFFAIGLIRFPTKLVQ